MAFLQAEDAVFQVSIPFIAGQWSLRIAAVWRAWRAEAVSIPFIAGQWSLQTARLGFCALLGLRFNPLHCGAVVASVYGMGPDRLYRKLVSIPFIAGQWSLQTGGGSGVAVVMVSIPFIAGQWSLLPRTTPSSLFGVLLRKRRLPCDHIICTRLPF